MSKPFKSIKYENLFAILIVFIVGFAALSYTNAPQTKCKITSTDNSKVSYTVYYSGTLFKEGYYKYESLPKIIIVPFYEVTFFLYEQWAENGTLFDYIHGPFEINDRTVSYDRVIYLHHQNVSITKI